MKKYLSLAILFAAFLVISSPVSAQFLNFFNGSNCAVKVQAYATPNANPCIGLYCPSAVILVPPLSSASIPTGCPGYNTFRGFQFWMDGGIVGGADICSISGYSFRDCLNNKRTVKMFFGNTAAIF